ncbi:hypothetical protein [Aquabacterium sp. OR-4]|uniref:hypothetical protein n=1 Tax=Aquabacterium sp. OR-4 TaxID=2978127 RepID=UPI0021B45CB2|nr:hypothetical protein [Aquabacterium sp. OR-4]MDT7835780.1 hypothetical protein [Aquabacterium sp. OR-4]
MSRLPADCPTRAACRPPAATPRRRQALLALAALLGAAAGPLPTQAQANAQAQAQAQAQPPTPGRAPGPGKAALLKPPQGKVLLSVSGAIGITNAPGRADFDLAMLDALPQHGFTTATPWFKQPRRFSGPLLRDVLAAAGAQGKTLKAVALNNYKAEIPAADAQAFKMLMATRLDDKPMSLREKGPLFIIYPFDDNADLRQERYYSRSAWQLRALEVK